MDDDARAVGATDHMMRGSARYPGASPSGRWGRRQLLPSASAAKGSRPGVGQREATPLWRAAQAPSRPTRRRRYKIGRRGWEHHQGRRLRRRHFPNEHFALKIVYLTVRERLPNRASPTGRISGGRAILNNLRDHLR